MTTWSPDGKAKTILGAAQKEWLLRTLRQAQTREIVFEMHDDMVRAGIPTFLYGTAWKEEETERLTRLAARIESALPRSPPERRYAPKLTTAKLGLPRPAFLNQIS